MAELDLLIPKKNRLYVLIEALPTCDFYSFLRVDQTRSVKISEEGLFVEGVGEIVTVKNFGGFDLEFLTGLLATEVDANYSALPEMGGDAISFEGTMKLQRRTGCEFEDDIPRQKIVYAVIDNENKTYPLGFNDKFYHFFVPQEDSEEVRVRGEELVAANPDIKDHSLQLWFMTHKCLPKGLLEHFRCSFDDFNSARLRDISSRMEAMYLLKKLEEIGFDYTQFKQGLEGIKIGNFVSEGASYDEMQQRRFYGNNMITDLAIDLQWRIGFGQEKLVFREWEDYKDSGDIGKTISRQDYDAWVHRYNLISESGLFK